MVKVVPEAPKPGKKENKTYQDIYDTINQSNLKPGSPQDYDSNPLSELDQFEPTKETMAESPHDPKPHNYYSEIPEAPEAPMPPSYGYSGQGIQQDSSSQVQEIVESLIEEKWEDVLNKVGDIGLWKERVEMDLTSIKQEIIRTQTHFMSLQKSVLGKVHDYNQSILDVNTEMQALEKVFQKILEPLSTNVKELSKITEKLKKK